MTPGEMVREAARDGKALRQMVGDAEIVPLLMSLVQLTGRREYLDLARPYIAGAWHYLQTIPKDLQRRIRTDLVAAIESAADDGRAIVDQPAPELLDDMIEVAVGRRLTDEYRGVFRDETNFGGVDNRRVQWRRGRPKQADDFLVVVIGAGFSGVAAAIKLKEAGIPFVVVEKNPDVGGTWFENTYPGLGVDTPCHFYSYAFEPNAEWSSYFAEGSEILAYIRKCADKHGIRQHIRFNEELVSAHFDEAANRWVVRTRGKDGADHEIVCNALFSGAGILNRPMLPNIPGRDSFKGPAFHSAAWDKGFDPAGKRVAQIGVGASGIQIAPTIAPVVDQLYIFQRSPHWVIKHPLYHENVSSAVRWAMANIPFYASWFRFRLFYAASDGFHATLKMDPDWKHKAESLNEANHKMRQELIAAISLELADRPDLLAKAIPSYPPFGKRMLRDNNWFRTLKRDNVELVTEDIDRIEADAVVAGGKRYPVDAIVYATGFHASRMLWPMDIRGRGGVSLRDLWGDDDPRAHLGITVPGFPNLFLFYGPNTNLAHGGSAVFHSECQLRYAILALREVIEAGASTIEVKKEPFEAYNERVDEAMRSMVWSHGGVTSWYKNKKGRVTMNSPWRLVDYRNMTAELDVENYRIDGSDAGKAISNEAA